MSAISNTFWFRLYVHTQQIPEEDPAAAESTAAAGIGKVKSFGMSIFSSIKGAGQKIKDTVIFD